MPASHLLRFADPNDRVRVRKRDDVANGFVTNVINVAVERDFYAVEYADGWSDDIERLLAQIDGQGSAALEFAIAETFPPADGERVSIANYVALQWLRGRDHREGFQEVQAKLKKHKMMNLPREEMRRGMHEMEGRPPADEEIDELIVFLSDPDNFDYEPHQNSSIALMLQVLPELTNLLLQRRWVLLRAPGGAFLTSDAPVTLFTKPERHNPFFGIGFGTAEEVCFAVDRRHALLFVSDERMREERREIGSRHINEINRRTATSGVRWVIHHPNEDPLLDLELPPSAPKSEFSIPLRRLID